MHLLQRPAAVRQELEPLRAHDAIERAVLERQRDPVDPASRSLARRSLDGQPRDRPLRTDVERELEDTTDRSPIHGPSVALGVRGGRPRPHLAASSSGRAREPDPAREEMWLATKA